ncbi:unnamed protein product [Closterium sp. Naga37s-1]|nr:unnamed protein product [Closterium sp. Naga37s-1]
MASAVALQGSSSTSSGLLAPRLSSNKPRCASLASTLVPLPRKLTSSRTTPAQPFSRQRCSVVVNAQAPSSSSPQRSPADESLPASQQLPSLPSSLTEAKTSLLNALKAAVKPALAALLISAVLAAGAPDAALAAMGGGRIGGSGFGASRMRSYAPPPSAPRGGGYSYNAPPVIVGPSVPFFAPSPFFFFGPSIAYGGGGGGIFNLLVIGIVVWFVSQSVMGFVSSTQEEGVWQETQRSSVVRLQVGLLGSARRLQWDLDRIADRADASSPEGLHYILQETVLALLRNPDYCIYGFSSSEMNNDSYAGEAAFNRMSMEERSKFKEETLVNVDGIRRRITRKPSQDRFNSEYIVVTVLAAAEGTFKLPEIKSSSDLREALTRLGSVPADELQAVEVLWTPQDDEDTLTERDLLVDFPRLRPLLFLSAADADPSLRAPPEREPNICESTGTAAAEPSLPPDFAPPTRSPCLLLCAAAEPFSSPPPARALEDTTPLAPNLPPPTRPCCLILRCAADHSVRTLPGRAAANTAPEESSLTPHPPPPTLPCCFFLSAATASLTPPPGRPPSGAINAGSFTRAGFTAAASSLPAVGIREGSSLKLAAGVLVPKLWAETSTPIRDAALTARTTLLLAADELSRSTRSNISSLSLQPLT